MLVLAGLVLLVVAGGASAQDEGKPHVIVPEDIPGADVILFYGNSYTFDVSQSYDDEEGIWYFIIEFKDAGTPVQLYTENGLYDYTFMSWGQTWVTVHAWDWAGNEGKGYFSIDVVELIEDDTSISSSYIYLDHSIYFKDADISIDSSTVVFGDGAGSSPAGGGGQGVPDILGESLYPEADDLSGYWTPYYYNYYGNGYGYQFEDYDNKMSGDLSIGMSGGDWGAMEGWEYHFNNNVDLTPYNTMSFWIKASGYYSNWLYIQLYGDENYNWPYSYWYYQICYDMARYGWYGITISLDPNNVAYGYNGMGSYYSVKVIQIEFYADSWYGPCWIDNVAIYKANYADSITEDPYPSGDMSGRWYGYSVGQGWRHYVGDYSVQIYLPSYSYTTIGYKFDSPQDLSGASALRMFDYYEYYYLWWYGQFYVYFANGGYAYCSYNPYFNYYCYAYGHWGLLSMPWGPNAGYWGNNIDWSQVTGFEWTSIYGYVYTYLYIDGLEFVTTGAGGGGKSDTVPLAIYTENGDMSVTGGTYVQGSSKTGARLMCSGGDGTFQQSTFDSLWVTQYPGVENSHNILGGIEVYGGDSVVDNVTFTNCKGPGLALFDGKMKLDPSTIELGGTAQKLKGSPMMILGATEHATGPVRIDLTGWTMWNSPAGSGVMIMCDRATVSVDVQIHDNTIEKNVYDGIIISNWGGACDLNVDVYDQELLEMGDSGFVYWSGKGDWSPQTTAEVSLKNVSATRCAKDGIVFDFTGGATNLDVKMEDVMITSSGASGLTIRPDGFFGTVTFDMLNVTSTDNTDEGLFLDSDTVPYIDVDGNLISPVSTLDIAMVSCGWTGNSARGIYEQIDVSDTTDGSGMPPWVWAGETRSTLYLTLTAEDIIIAENSGGGWASAPDEGTMWGNFHGDRTVSTCAIEDNRGAAFYVEPYCDLSGSDAVIEDVWNIKGCTITDNAQGFVQYLGAYNYGYKSAVYITSCRVEGSDAEALLFYGAESSDGIHTWGISEVLSAMVYIDSCRFNSPIVFSLTGANDLGDPNWDAKMGVQFTNNIVDVEEDIRYSIGSDPSCERFTAWGDVGANKFYKKIVEDGFSLDIYGGHNTVLDFTLRDQVYDKAPGSGVNLVVGSLWSGFDTHQMSGAVTIKNVTIREAAWNGINVTADNAQPIGMKNRATLTGDGLIIDGVVQGIYATEMAGKVYNSKITHCTSQAVFISYAVFDFYGCDVGAMTTDNIRVMTKGAARMWFDVKVDVKWASGERVVGAVVSMSDNTFSTIGVSTMGAAEAVPFGYVNSYTILPDSVYAKSPFLVEATYLGLSTEKTVDITVNTVVDLVLVDDVMPRLTVTTPADGSAQTSLDLEVKGFAWDLHSGLEAVLVSINGEDWFTATGTQEFNYTFVGVREGQIILQVKAVDFAGNEKVESIAVLLDATAPVIQIIEPKLDVFSTSNPTLDIIGVTELGATVTVADVRVALDMTLFTSQVTLREGPNEVRVMAADRLGNTAVHIIRVTLDTIPPPLIVTEPVVGAVLGKASVTVSGQTEEGAQVRVNGVPVANIGGAFHGRTTLVEGQNVIVVETEDAIGNIRTVRVPVTIDTLAPWINVVSPVAGKVYGATGIPVDGWVEAGTRVLVNDRLVTVTSGHFVDTVFGSEGQFTVSILGIDLAGNEMSKTYTVIVDTTAPTVTLESPRDGDVTSAEFIMLVGSLSWDRESFRDVSFTLNDAFVPFSAEGLFRERIPLGEGTNPLTLIVTDDVGNARTLRLTVVRDSTAPFLMAEATPTFMHPVWNKPATYNAIVYIEGDTEPGATVTVDGAEIDVGADGHFNVSIALADIQAGQELSHSAITVVAKDAAGNEKEQVIDVYRLKEVEKKKGFAKYEGAQWWALLLSIVILVMAIITAWLLLRASEKNRLREEEEAAAAMTAEGGR